MKLFFSGSGRQDIEADPRLGSPRYRLFSAHAAYEKVAHKNIPYCTEIDDDIELMFDSGAFTAWTKGDEVTLDEVRAGYTRLLELSARHGVKRCWLINLDVIPGRKGMDAQEIARHVPEALAKSDENYQALVKEFGDIVLPVLHMQEPIERLQEVCDMSAGYIMLSPRNDWPEKERRDWSQNAHALLPEGIRTHGLGATGVKMTADVPWHSVDSTSWIMFGMYGRIYVPGSLKIIAISEDSDALKEAGKHYKNIPKPQLKVIDEYAERKGFDLDELAVDFIARVTWNRCVQSDYCLGLEHTQAIPRQEGLFGAL